MVNFLNFTTLRPDISKTGSHTKKIIFTQNLLKVVRNALEPKKNTIFYFYYPSQNFALWQKIAVTQNFYPIFFYSLDPPLSEFKVKIRGHPFAYRCYSSNRTIISELFLQTTNVSIIAI